MSLTAFIAIRTAARRYHYVLIDFFCRVIGGELKPSGDAAQARWMAREELGNFAITETAQKVIRKALERGNRSFGLSVCRSNPGTNRPKDR